MRYNVLWIYFTRSLLSKNAAPVYKLINDIFGMISKFEMRLISHSWQEDKETGMVTHPMFSKLQQSYRAFRQCIEFLFSGMFIFVFCVMIAEVVVVVFFFNSPCLSYEHCYNFTFDKRSLTLIQKLNFLKKISGIEDQTYEILNKFSSIKRNSVILSLIERC